MWVEPLRVLEPEMPRRPLTPDEALYVRVDAIADNATVSVANRRRDRDAGVAAILAAAEGRADIVDQVIDATTRRPPPALDWPPRALRLELLAAARERLGAG